MKVFIVLSDIQYCKVLLVLASLFNKGLGQDRYACENGSPADYEAVVSVSFSLFKKMHFY